MDCKTKIPVNVLRELLLVPDEWNMSESYPRPDELAFSGPKSGAICEIKRAGTRLALVSHKSGLMRFVEFEHLSTVPSWVLQSWRRLALRPSFYP